MRLSVNFSLRELCKTKTGIENVPNEEQVNNLKRVCGWLEKLRKRWNERYADIGNGGMEEPLIINSGYRSPAVNKAVGGAPTSNHLTGCGLCGGHPLHRDGTGFALCCHLAGHQRYEPRGLRRTADRTATQRHLDSLRGTPFGEPEAV